jgi:hypothetical protein
MSWLDGFLLKHYRRRRAIQHAAMADAAPLAEHELLGLGGRSIELSMGRGKAPDPSALILAADVIHDRLEQELTAGTARDLLADAVWLRDAWPDGAAPNARSRLTTDMITLAATAASTPD